MIAKTKRELIGADLFCGAGGMTTGAQQSGYVRVGLAVNHWRTAIFTHETNHPETRHICAEMEHVDPHGDKTLPDVDLVMAGVECTHHSNAKGGAPVCDQRRSSARHVLEWVKAKRPKYMVVENVREFRDWGPTRLKRNADGKRIWDKRHQQWAREPDPDRKGTFFREWVAELEGAGYHVEHRLLNSADYGEATKRIRLFVIARRDGGPIPWPEPTHAAVANGKPQWRAAAEIIDWDKTAPSIFGRKRPLAEKTLRRIEIGLLKFCAPQTIDEGLARCHRSAESFLVKLRGTGSVGQVDTPLPTVTAHARHLCVAEPFLVKYHSGADHRKWQGSSASIASPVPTLDTQPRFALAEPFVMQSQGPGWNDPRYAGVFSVREPLRTILARNNYGVVAPFVFGVDHRSSNGAIREASAPLTTVTSKQRHCLVEPFLVPNFGERPGQPPRSHGVHAPLPTVTGHGAGCLVTPFLLPRQGYFDARRLKPCRSIDRPLNTITSHVPAHLVVPYLIEVNHGDGGGRSPGGRVHSLAGPLGTITGRRAHGLIVPEPMLVEYYGTATARPVSEPISTLTTKPRHGLTLFGDTDGVEKNIITVNEHEAKLLNTMLLLGIQDIGFRMLEVDELAAAMGLPDDYYLHGNKADQIKQIGNMVCVRVMRAICEAIGRHEDHCKQKETVECEFP